MSSGSILALSSMLSNCSVIERWSSLLEVVTFGTLASGQLRVHQAPIRILMRWFEG